MRLGLQRAALAKLLAHAAHRRHAETGKLCDLSRVLALLVKFKNALPQGDRYGSHAPTLPQALAVLKLLYLWKPSRHQPTDMIAMVIPPEFPRDDGGDSCRGPQLRAV